jgi:hypothetical protein
VRRKTPLRRRRRTSVADPGNRYEYLQVDSNGEPMGFTGTAPQASTQAAGLATLAADGFG